MTTLIICPACGSTLLQPHCIAEGRRQPECNWWTCMACPAYGVFHSERWAKEPKVRP